MTYLIVDTLYLPNSGIPDRQGVQGDVVFVKTDDAKLVEVATQISEVDRFEKYLRVASEQDWVIYLKPIENVSLDQLKAIVEQALRKLL